MSTENTVKVQKPKGTKQTEVIIGAASLKLEAATKSLNNAVTEALKLSSTMDEQSLKIAENEEKLSNLVKEYTNLRAQNKLDLELAYKADQRAFVEKYLHDNGLVSVSHEELSDLKGELEDTKKNFEEKVQKEVNTRTAVLIAKHESDKKIMESEYKAREAGNLAKIENLTSQLQFTEKQSESWRQQLIEQRNASVEIAKSSAVGNITVNPNSK